MVLRSANLERVCRGRFMGRVSRDPSVTVADDQP